FGSLQSLFALHLKFNWLRSVLEPLLVFLGQFILQLAPIAQGDDKATGFLAPSNIINTRQEGGRSLSLACGGRFCLCRGYSNSVSVTRSLPGGE
ncbi:MAG: hypothetical protein LBS96_03440, partial [Oscillospiraceae bacterium]|nr:hypothetical protein [Oscillospiraceae bacterium]